jgi:hypothetical protein
LKERKTLMGKIRWVIFVAVIILSLIVCKLNVHHSHFNLFMLGLFLLNFVVILVFWLMDKWEALKNAEGTKGNEGLDT